MANQPERAFEDLRNTLAEYARIVRYRWRLGLIGAGLVGSLAFWASQYLPRLYRTSTLFERRDDVVLRNLIHRNSPYSFDTLKSSIVMDMIGSRALAEVAVGLGLLPAAEFPPQGPLSDRQLRLLEATLARHRLKPAVRLIQSSASLDTIELSCQANDPQIANRFVLALRDRYVRNARARITEILLSTKEFFENEVARYRRQVFAANRALRRRFAEFPGIDPLEPSSAGNRLEALRFERERLLERRAELEAQIAAREQFLAAAPLTQPATAPAGELSRPAQPPLLPGTGLAIEREIEKVRVEIAEAMTVRRMTREHPAVKTLQRKLGALYAARQAVRAKMGSAPGGASSPGAERPRARWPAQRVRVELELEALRKQLEVIRPRYARADERLRRFEKLYQELLQEGEELRSLEDRLNQDTATAAVWNQHLAQLKRILAADSEQRGTQFVLLEDPKLAQRATSPRVGSVFAVCSGFGLAAAVLLVALAELLDRSFRSAGQVTRVLGIPVLECVRVIPTPRERRRRLVSRLAWTPLLSLLLAGLLGSAALAYVSLAHPSWHRRAIAKLDKALSALGVPPTELAGPPGGL